MFRIKLEVFDGTSIIYKDVAYDCTLNHIIDRLETRSLEREMYNERVIFITVSSINWLGSIVIAANTIYSGKYVVDFNKDNPLTQNEKLNKDINDLVHKKEYK